MEQDLSKRVGDMEGIAWAEDQLVIVKSLQRGWFAPGSRGCGGEVRTSVRGAGGARFPIAAAVGEVSREEDWSLRSCIELEGLCRVEVASCLERGTAEHIL